ncbi:MAG: hypothetical protein H7836_06250 [Magnetococcus sp. YQC-3]
MTPQAGKCFFDVWKVIENSFEGNKKSRGPQAPSPDRLRRMLRRPEQKPAPAFLKDKNKSKIPGLCPGLSHGG